MAQTIVLPEMAMTDPPELVDSRQDTQIATVEARQEATEHRLDRLDETLNRLNARLDSLQSNLRTPSSTVAAWAGLILVVIMASMSYVISHVQDGHPSRVEREVELLRELVDLHHGGGS